MLGMPLDQRMAYYKNKYSGKQPSGEKTAEPNSAKNEVRSRRHRRRKPNAPRAESAQTEANSAMPGSRRGKRPQHTVNGNAKPVEPYVKMPKPQAPVQEPSMETSGKGLFSRFFGLFKKNK
jgi:hypothetical protein